MAASSDWAPARTRLADELADLTEGEFVIVAEPTPDPPPRRGLLSRRPPPPPVRYVQFRDDGEWMYAECVGATLFGGDWEVTEDQHARLRGAGWLAPGDEDPSGTQPSYPNYWMLVPRAESARVAELGVDALAELGVSPENLEWRRDR